MLNMKYILLHLITRFSIVYHTLQKSLPVFRMDHKVYLYHSKLITTLQRRHNGCDGISNHQPRDCLLKRRSKKTSERRVTSICGGNSPVNSQMASNAGNVSFWWRHHENCNGHWHIMVNMRVAMSDIKLMLKIGRSRHNINAYCTEEYIMFNCNCHTSAVNYLLIDYLQKLLW